MKKKRQALTLIEIMLVIILIGIVGGTLAFNLKGAVSKGKQFKTDETKRKIDSILELAQLEGHSLQEIQSDWISYVKASPLIKTKADQDEILDGYGMPFDVEINDSGDALVAFTDNTLPDDS